jgi:hypothetical protein
MIRGTTPTIKFVFPFEVSNITKFSMYFMQGKDAIITRTEDDLTFSGNDVYALLTQEETLMMLLTVLNINKQLIQD